MFTCAIMHADTASCSAVLGLPLYQSVARPSEPGKVYEAPVWSALTSDWLELRAHFTRYATVRRPMPVVISPLVDDSPFVPLRPLRDSPLADRPLVPDRPWMMERPFVADSASPVSLPVS